MWPELSGVLSAAAAELYQRLAETGGLAPADHPGLEDRPETRELVGKGFARIRYVGTPLLVAVEPARAIDNALIVRQRELLDQVESLIRLRDDASGLRERYRLATPGEDVDDLVRVLTDRDEIGALSVELALSARSDLASLETEHFSRPPDPRSARPLPADLVARGVRFRNIYSRAALEVEGAREMLRLSVQAGWSSRVHPDVPMKMVLVDDRAALLPLGATGMEGALLVRAPVVVAALRGYFEMLWAAAVPVEGSAVRLPPEQDQVLRLLLTGMTDGAIARHLGISERTVRRHVGALQEALHAGNRVTLAATAVRQGWVD